jgi:hypothetical protein
VHFKFVLNGDKLIFVNLKLLIDIDENSKKGKLALHLLKELGLDTTELPSAIDYALPAKRKISDEELNFLLE